MQINKKMVYLPTKPKRIANFDSRYYIILLIIFILLVGLSIPPMFGLNHIQQSTLSLLVVSMILWSSKVISTGISALFIICLQMVLGIVPQFGDAVQGFLSTSLYFILAVTLVSTVMTKVGLDQMMSKLVVKFSNGSIQRISLGFYFATLILPIFMPSGNARLRMFVPLMEDINTQYNLNRSSSFIRFTTWTLGGMNQMATLIVFTGGGLAVIASQLIGNFNLSISWVKWFFLMAPPIWLICLITGVFMWKYWKMNKLSIIHLENEKQFVIPSSVTSQNIDKIPFFTVVISLFTMLVLWIFGSWFHVPSIVPPLLALTIFALPGIGLIKNPDIRSYDWENFLLLGSALSLAVTIEHNGTAAWIANQMLSLFGQSSYEFVNLGIVIFIILIIRSMFVSPVAALTVIFPLISAFSSSFGLDSAYTYLVSVLIIGSFIILPIHSPITLLAYETGHIIFKEHIIVSLVLLIITIFIVFLSYLWYWPLLL
jgi:sodium-dependent dicarboxylate transporter 2/3/5